MEARKTWVPVVTEVCPRAEGTLDKKQVNLITVDWEKCGEVGKWHTAGTKKRRAPLAQVVRKERRRH